ncbi:pepsin/retropepsin-like aspartic protease family protein [Ideonella sp. DXS29W]|uniref:Pepsin/retropepsin-like aspartic protease family protein n=1 Tax=Ideonella lacteola TaxID=2984193 RepID=A0ABU9BVZ6_9BURK
MSRRVALAAAWTLAVALYAPAAEAACRYSKFAALKVNTDSGRPHMAGTVNGYPINVLIDSGAYGTGLTRSAAEGAKLSLSHTDDASFGVGGESQEYQASVQEFTVGEAKWGRMRMRVIWDMPHDAGTGAILGANVLFQNDVELLLKDNTIHLFRPQDCKDTYLGYWDKDAIVLKMLDNRSADDLRAMVTVEVNGKPLRALLDTGADVSVIDTKAAEEVGVVRPPEAKEQLFHGIGSRRIASWVGSFKTVAIGPQEIRNTKLTVMNLWGAARQDLGYWGGESLSHSPQMILGADFLTSHRVLFANSQRMVYFTHLGGPVFVAGTPATPNSAAPEAQAGRPDPTAPAKP